MKSIFTLPELLSADFPPRESYLGPFERSSLNMVYAGRGVGKTWVVWSIGLALANGSNLFGWKCSSPRKVLIIDGEMNAAAIQERFKALTCGMGLKDCLPEKLSIWAIDLLDDNRPNLASVQGQKMITEKSKEFDVIIIDNLSCLHVSDVSDNDVACWNTIQEWELKMRSMGKMLILVHHSGKSGAMRGSSKKEDVLDISIELKHPLGYKHSDGCRVELHFKKNRHGKVGDGQSLLLTLNEKDNGLVWNYEHIDEPTDISDEVLAMLAKGANPTQIAKELNIGRTSVYRHKAKK